MKWRTPVILAGFLILSLVGCQNKKNPLSLELLGKKDLGQEKVVTIRKTDDIKIGTFEGQTAYSSEIFAGKAGGYSAFILIQFKDLHLISDTAQIDKAILRLYARSVINPQHLATLPLKIFSVKSNWVQTELSSDVSLDNYRGNLISSDTVSARTAAYDSLLLPPGVVKGWKDSTIENNGLLIEAENEAFIKSYNAYINENPPDLLVFFNVGNTRDSVRVNASKDLFLVKSTWQQQPGYAYVGEGVNLLSDFHFSLPVLPTNATIHKAVLHLSVDTTASLLGIDRVYALAKMPLLEEGGVLKADSTTIDSASYDVHKDHVTTLITDIVQKWVSGKIPNKGLRLAPRYPGADLFRIAFYQQQPDSLLNPTITLYYSIPPAK